MSSVPKPFDIGDISEWFTRFKICSKANEWNKANIAPEGKVLAVWIDLAEEEQADYKVVKEKLVGK